MTSDIAKSAVVQGWGELQPVTRTRFPKYLALVGNNNRVSLELEGGRGPEKTWWTSLTIGEFFRDSRAPHDPDKPPFGQALDLLINHTEHALAGLRQLREEQDSE